MVFCTSHKYMHIFSRSSVITVTCFEKCIFLLFFFLRLWEEMYQLSNARPFGADGKNMGSPEWVSPSEYRSLPLSLRETCRFVSRVCLKPHNGSDNYILCFLLTKAKPSWDHTPASHFFFYRGSACLLKKGRAWRFARAREKWTVQT